MAKIVSRGYRGSDDAEHHKYEFDLFANNGALIFANMDRILSEPRMASCLFGLAYCSYPYISGDGPLSLETLFTLWYLSARFIEECQQCKGKALIIGFGGSPASGSGSAWGFCIDCKSFHKGTGKFIDYFSKRIELYPNGPDKYRKDRYSLEDVIVLLSEKV